MSSYACVRARKPQNTPCEIGLRGQSIELIPISHGVGGKIAHPYYFVNKMRNVWNFGHEYRV